MTITNKSKTIFIGSKLNDKDYLINLEITLKNLSKLYITAMNEASNENLYNRYKENFERITKLQREVYELIFKKGWHQIDSIPTTEIITNYNKLFHEYQYLNL